MKMGFNGKFWNILENIFSKRQLRVITQLGPTDFFSPKTGLEQGDPASTVLWNIFYEQLLQELDCYHGYRMGSCNISYLAYADDLTLIAENDDQMDILINSVVKFLKKYNMEIQPKNRLSVQITNQSSLSLKQIIKKFQLLR